MLDLSVGISHWSETNAGAKWSDPPVTFYFAPSTIKERSAKLGRETYFGMYAEAWAGFAPSAAAGLDFEESSGVEALQQKYHDTVAGLVSPRQGLIVLPAS